MNFLDLIYERRGAAAWVRLNRPADLNALSNRLLDEIPAALAQAADDAGVGAIVFAAAGRAFCAGADLKFVNDLPEQQRADESNAFVARAAAMMDRIERFPKPVIAAVNGVATAGGMELVLACDIVIAARSARLGDGHANFGLLPGAGASARLPRKIGLNRANYLFFTGEFMSAEEMRSAGLVNLVVDDAELDATVEAFVAKIASKSPIGLARMKALAGASCDLPLAAALAQEQHVSQLHAHSFDRNEGIAAFVEKRKPKFQGR